eukprot:m.181488 g.181488  ORF g.181488 m.181488 type:complete len:450 (-) comp15514_c1_seq14:191-1540(-)
MASLEEHFKLLNVSTTSGNEEILASYKSRLANLPPEHTTDNPLETENLRAQLTSAYKEICAARGIEPGHHDPGPSAGHQMLTAMPNVQLRKKRRAKSTDKFVPKVEGGVICGMKWACASLQGHRDTMEDEHIGVEFSDWPDLGCFAVFDGHGGASVATACVNSDTGIARQITTACKSAYECTNGSPTAREIGCSLYQGICILDEELRVKLGDEREMSGATAVVAVTAKDHIVIANLGDSRAIIARSDGLPPHETQDHKPGLPKETERITAAGGFVINNRVNSFVGVSRALGDFEYKNPDKPQYKHVITACSEIYCVPKANCEFMVLACDGIWDVMSTKDVIAFVREQLQDGQSLTEICQELTSTCLSLHSEDNMTVLICLFKDPEDIGKKLSEFEHDGSLMEDLLPHNHSSKFWCALDEIDKEQMTLEAELTHCNEHFEALTKRLKRLL